ncbi:MAG: glycine betaine--corrinoid protein methyltransferase [Anaerolineae bacterium]
MQGIRSLLGQPTKVLTQSDLETIHETSLRILKLIGVEFQSQAALKAFRGRTGVSVEGSRVCFSRQVVERSIDRAPGTFTLHARNPANDLTLGRDQVLMTSAFGATFVCDSENRAYRKATLDDLAKYILLADRLENVHYVLTPFIPQDIAPGIAEIYAAAVQFNYTEKHVGIGLPTSDHLDELHEMGRLIAEGAGIAGPIYSLGATVNSPLVYSAEMLGKMIHAAQYSIPLRIVSGALAGATAPVTLAGALALQNAEILAGITLCQSVSPGCPVIYGTFVGGMDMRTGKWAAAGPEMTLINSSSAQLCQMYDIPFGYGTGGVTDSRMPDVRAGFEKGLTNLGAALCGVEVIHDGVSGLMAGGMAISFEQFVIDNEVAKWIARFLQGIEVNQDTLAFDIIQTVGPGGLFLAQEHTVRRFRGEHLISPLLSREYALDWPASDAEEIVFQAQQRVRDILANHQPHELAPEVKRAIQAILQRLGGERVLF